MLCRFPILAVCMLLLVGGRGVAQSVAEPVAQPRWIPDSVEFLGDVPYAGTDNPRQKLDLLLPRTESNDPLPVVVFIHGGAWLAGDKRADLRQALPYAESGQYAAASIGYRLSGEAKWPAQIHDCKAAIRWLRANAPQHRLDPQRIGVVGASAGGHLAAVLGTSGDVEAMEGTIGPHVDATSRVACVVDLFGPTDFLQMNRTALAGARFDHDGPDAPGALLIGGPIQDNKEKVAAANPMTYVTPDDAPFLIVHGTRDPLVPFNQSELLHQALRQVQATSTLITIEGAGLGQGFPAEVRRMTRRFFDHHLRGVRSEWKDETLPAAK
ncbi:MAG: alpha/beta hydrolase [Pirellulales bacterium]|nr:alpha/beta hydrolase [Pirellulales bacterium]